MRKAKCCHGWYRTLKYIIRHSQNLYVANNKRKMAGTPLRRSLVNRPYVECRNANVVTKLD